ncbi:hypothetical protein AVEN_160173-1 [Araneus ventricosus]|uniref:Transposase Tc1-like domain-containing protein n=1 Tax=Araneus ventricosus TaxID=182803 RepID=A0A4Y2WFQ2_ARAVE|nr:hypothetical protein AVEN_160173-1 [Araneus ventricosus]
MEEGTRLRFGDLSSFRKNRREIIHQPLPWPKKTLATISNHRFSIQEVQPRTANRYNERRYLPLCARRNRTATPIQLRSSLAAATGKLVSTSTVRRRLHEGGLYARRPAIFVSRHRRGRLRWAQQHVHWTPDQWRTVLFTDESRFCLQSDSRRYLVWREPGTRYHPPNIRAYGGGSVCVWGGIYLGGRTHLHVVPRRTVNAQAYRDYILHAYDILYAGAIGDDFLLQEPALGRQR